MQMSPYLGVRVKNQKGRRMWAARVYDTALGCARTEAAAAEIVRKIGQVASVKHLVIPSTVLCPQSVAR